MKTFYIKLESGTTASCQGESAMDAKSIAKAITGKNVIEVWNLPYPSANCLWKHDHPVYGQTPSFCYEPEDCKGRTSCPKRYACTE